jgi:TP901 family phage tail tape measure protein
MAGKKTSVIQVMIAGDARDLQKATRQGVSGFDLLAGAAIAATKIIASAATAIAGFSIREFAKFDDAMTKSTAIMGDLSDSMRKDMSDAARQVALETTFAADQAAEAFFFLASAGLTAEQSIAALPQVARFAQAGAFDLATATDLLTDAQSALGLTSDDTAENLANMARVSDVLAKANTASNATIQEFSEALTEKAGVAMRQLGIDIEEGTAALAVFADQGVKGTKAGTLLNTTLEGLARTADTNTEAYERLGVSVFDNEGQMRNLADIVGDLEGAFDGMSVQARNAELRNLGFTRQARDGVLQLIGNSEALREYENELRNAAGTTDEIAEKQLQSFNAQLSLLRSGLSDVGISIGEALAGPLGNFVSWFREQIPAVKVFVEEAIPQVEAFVNRAVAKFREFKQFYDDNIAEPLRNLLERLREIGGITLGKIFEFKDAAAGFLVDFAQAVANEDSEEAGRVLGEAITKLLKMAIDAGGDLTGAIGDWFGRQDWGAIGASVAIHAGSFAKGLFRGLFTVIDEETGESEYDWSAFMRLLAAGLVLRIPVFRNALSQRSGLFSLPIVGTLLTALGNVTLLLTPGLGRLGSFVGTTLAGRIGAAVAGTRVAGIFSNIGLTLQRLFAGEFASLPARLGASITGMFSGIGGFLLRNAKLLPTFIKQGLIVGFPTLVVWLKTGGLLTLLKGFAAVLAGIVVAIGGWPLVLFAAAAAAFAEFIRRFARWNEDQGDEYESFGAKIVAFISQGVEKMKDWFRDKFVQWFKDRWAAITSWFEDQQGDFENIGSRIVDGMIQGIKNAGSRLMESLRNAARRAVGAAQKELEVKSPSQVFARIGDELMAGMSLGIDRSSMDAVGAMVDASRQISGVDFRTPEVELGGGRGMGGQTTINVTVTSADPQAVVEAIRRYTRANGPLGQVVNV